MNNTNNISARQSYEQAKKMFAMAMADKFPGNPAGAMQWANGLKLSQSEIRLETLLNLTNTSYKFGLTQNQPNSANIPFNTENRLTMQDSLCVNEYGIYVGKPAANDDVLWELETYGNPVTFAGANEALNINSAFFDQGAFRLTCNNDVLMPYRQLWNHKYRGVTQQTAPVAAGSPFDQIRGNEDGMITCEPNFVLIGSKGYIPEIILPKALTAVPAFARVIIIFRGVLAQNSTNVS